MSYDLYLTIDTGSDERALVVECGNMTSNVAPMWRLAGANLAEFAGKTAADCLPLLRAAVASMEDNPAPYLELNPPNGWGSYDTCLEYLRGLVRHFAAHPLCTVEVSR